MHAKHEANIPSAIVVGIIALMNNGNIVTKYLIF